MLNILVTIPNGVTKDTFITPDVRKELSALGNVFYNDTEVNYDEKALSKKLIDIDICIAGWGSACFTGEVLKNANRLKIVAYTAGSVANIVSKELYDKGIIVLSGNKVFAESVAESIIAYSLSALRDIPYHAQLMQNGGWSKDGYYNEGLLDQTVGLVGFGEIPKYLVAMLKPFRAKIKAFDKFVSKEKMAEFGVQKAELDEIFTTSHIISLNLPKTQDTYHMVDSRLLKLIPDGAILINTARGSVIDEEALTLELGLNRFKAVLDVYDKEPLPTTSPLRKMENAILIPHMGGPTVDRRKYATISVLDDINRFYAGEPLIHDISYERACLMTH